MKNRVRIRNFLIITISCIFFSTSVRGQAVGSWTFNSTQGGTPGMYNTVSTAVFGPGVTSTAFNGGSEFYGQGGWPVSTINTNAYLQLSLTPNTGYQIDLTSVVLRMRRSNTGSPAGSGPTAWSIRSSLDGYSANIATGTMNHNYATYNVALPISFHSLHTTITFRVYGYAATVPSGGSSRMVFDQITVNGLNIVLPVHLSGFSVRHLNGIREVKFQAYNSSSLKAYSIERSSDGQQFVTVKTFNGTALPDETFEVKDLTASENNSYYYRVKVQEEDGSQFYSAIVYSSGTANEASALKMYGSALHLPAFAGKGLLRIYSTNGALLYQSTIIAAGQAQLVSWPLRSGGVYILCLSTREKHYSARVFAD